MKKPILKNINADGENFSTILDSISFDKTLKRISHEIIEKKSDSDTLAVIGICTRGETLAKRITENLKSLTQKEIPFGILDITLYRDDVRTSLNQPHLKRTEIYFDINNKKIILVDDVLFTGRTIQAALNALRDLGRAKSIELCVLIDRGHREIPIKADYVGKNIATSKKDSIIVKVKEIDGEDIVIKKNER